MATKGNKNTGDKPQDGVEETEITQPTSRLDLERRLEDGYVPDSNVTGTYRVNPNPFGEEEYAGTDPIYQNYANDVNKPLAADGGVDEQQEQAIREAHSLDDLDDNEVAEDYGLGGLAQKADAAGLTHETFLVPGQEGYPENPEKFTGPPVPRSAVEGDDDGDDDEDDGVTESEVTGLNMGGSTQPPSTGDAGGE